MLLKNKFLSLSRSQTAIAVSLVVLSVAGCGSGNSGDKATVAATSNVTVAAPSNVAVAVTAAKQELIAQVAPVSDQTLVVPTSVPSLISSNVTNLPSPEVTSQGQLLTVLPKAAAGPTLQGCPLFPSDNILNQPIDAAPVHANSTQFVASIGATLKARADFGSGLYNGAPIGIPVNVVDSAQLKVPVVFDIPDESETGPYPIPPAAKIEGGEASAGDRHVIVLDKSACRLYETYSSYKQADNSWTAYSGAIFDLNSNALRPDRWTSADAAGLAIAPALVRYDEVASGEIKHALRFTVPRTAKRYVWPATHYASSSTDLALPDMGLRFRLKADFDISGFDPSIQVILTALKKYGMVLADNGAPWFISGEPDERWNNDLLAQLRTVPGSAFEAVDVSSKMVSPRSGQAK
jgi:hypothetical protein